MAVPGRVSSAAIVVLSLCGLAACGGGSPARPSPAGPAVTTVEVGVAGNAPAQLAPGETRQLFARANQSDGTTIDVTNLATWQSSNPQVAAVSNVGVLTAAAEGAIDVVATHANVRGAVRAEIRGCEVVISPTASSFSAFGGTQTVDVVASTADCRWTVRGDAGWFPFAYEPARGGTGSFTYTLPPNSTPGNRSVNVIVASANGATAPHAISQARPVSCSDVAQPEEATFTAAGAAAHSRWSRRRMTAAGTPRAR